MKPKITVVGSYNTDLVVRTPRMPAPGETILGGPYFTGPGGKGGNQAVAAARLGADTTLLVKIGRDYYGDGAVQNFETEGIHTQAVIRSDTSHTGTAFIIVDQGGENMIVVASGANMQFTPADVQAMREAILQADLLVLQLEIPIETVTYAASQAHAAGIPVLLNPAPAQTLEDGLLKMVDYLTPNVTELQQITGLAVREPREAAQAGAALLERGVKNVVVTLGEKGALAVTSGGHLHVPGRRVDALDTTGAGDAFNGALAVAIAEGQGLPQGITFANAAAALQVTRLGAAPAMPYRDEVERLLATG